MSLTPTVPPFLPDILGKNADVRDIPEENSQPTGQLNYKSGYPLETALPPQSGGVAPQREDFNAVNRLFSQHHVFQQAGGVYPWQETLDYIKGCHVLGTDGKEYVATAWNGPGSTAGVRNPIDADVSKNYWHCYTDDIATNTTAIAKNTANITTIFDRLDDVSNWESTALMHNNIYRGANLLGDGHFASIAAVMAALRAGNFDDIYVGDYIPATFTVDSTTYTDVKFRIAAINLLNARSGAWGTTSPNLCIVPDANMGSSYMNSTSTTVGGYVGSYMYTTVLPKYYAAIAGNSGAPFNGYLKTTTERLTNAIDTSKACNGYSGRTGAATGVANYTNQNLTLMSEVEVYGHNHWSSTAWDGETIAVQLPMFRLNPNTITGNGSRWWWLRGVTGSTLFCLVYATFYAACDNPSTLHHVRPRFFVA